jgi:hypothetical protein
MPSIMAGIVGGALQGGAEQGIKEVDFQQSSDLTLARDARLNEWKEKHDMNVLDRQSKIEDKRTERADAANRSAEERANARNDSILERERIRQDSLLDRTDKQESARQSRAEADADRRATRDEEVARHNRVSELSKLAQQQLANGLQSDYQQTMQQIRAINNPMPPGGGLPPKPARGASSETKAVRDGVGDISKVTNPSSEDLMVEIGKVQDEISSGKLKPEDAAARKTYLTELQTKHKAASAREIGPPAPAPAAASATKPIMQGANPYLNESNYTIDDLNRLSMTNPGDPLLAAALKVRLKQKQDDYSRDRSLDANAASVMQNAGYN